MISLGKKRAGPQEHEVGALGWAILGGILIAAFLLRVIRLSEPPGGFLVFNEIFYIDAAVRQASAGPFSWYIHPVNLDKPPLYTGVVAMLYALDLPHLAAARLVSVLSGTVTVFATFMLGRLLYDLRTALVAAAALAFMPGVVLIDHNIQVDSLFVALLLASVCLYVVAVKSNQLLAAYSAGGLLGLSILTKQPAILALPAIAAWEMWSEKSIRPLHSKRYLTFAGTALTLGLSWYLLQFLIAPARLFADIAATGGREAMSSKVLGFWVKALPLEFVWMLFPLAAMVVVLGFLELSRERQTGDQLVMVFLVSYFLFYIQYHIHSYYMLPMAPFLHLLLDVPAWVLLQSVGQRLQPEYHWL